MSFYNLSVWTAPIIPVEGENIRLVPLTESRIDDIVRVGMDERIWTFFPRDLSDRQKHKAHLYNILDMMRTSACFAFVIEEKATGRTAGMTRLFNLCVTTRQCEVGSWLHPDYWSTGTNSEAKHLLLEYCFQVMRTIRVQFRTDTRNIRSKTALEKIGARYEGILRAERILENGYARDAAFYSILEHEWPEVDMKLRSKFRKHHINPSTRHPEGIIINSGTAIYLPAV